MAAKKKQNITAPFTLLKEKLLFLSGETYGWLFPQEASALYTIAKEVQVNGAIVEIGSFVGKSTIAIAAGNVDGSNRPFYTIDTHEGNPEHRNTDNPYFDGTGMTTHAALLENLAKAGVAKSVTVIKADALTLDWQEEISFMFVDTCHEYDCTHDTLVRWSQFVAKDGIIAIHDYVPFAGAVDDWLANSDFEKLKLVETMLVVKRLGK